MTPTCTRRKSLQVVPELQVHPGNTWMRCHGLNYIPDAESKIGGNYLSLLGFINWIGIKVHKVPILYEILHSCFSVQNNYVNWMHLFCCNRTGTNVPSALHSSTPQPDQAVASTSAPPVLSPAPATLPANSHSGLHLLWEIHHHLVHQHWNGKERYMIHLNRHWHLLCLMSATTWKMRIVCTVCH